MSSGQRLSGRGRQASTELTLRVPERLYPARTHKPPEQKPTRLRDCASRHASFGYAFRGRGKIRVASVTPPAGGICPYRTMTPRRGGKRRLPERGNETLVISERRAPVNSPTDTGRSSQPGTPAFSLPLDLGRLVNESEPFAIAISAQTEYPLHARRISCRASSVSRSRSAPRWSH